MKNQSAQKSGFTTQLDGRRELADRIKIDFGDNNFCEGKYSGNKQKTIASSAY